VTKCIIRANISLILAIFLLQGNMNLSADLKLEKATFAGGCFWCMESPFEKLEGVVEVVSGYAGGHKDNPSYEEVSSGITGHAEAVEIIYDPSKITYEKLLNIFWRQIDPTDAGGQFADRGLQYRSAIFYHDDGQKRAAEKSKKILDESLRYKKPIVTEIIKFSLFYPAEEYHQDYYKRRPVRYKLYRYNSGRDKYLRKIWGDAVKPESLDKNDRKHKKFSDEELKKKLTPLQYKVTQEDGTERAFCHFLLL